MKWFVGIFLVLVVLAQLRLEAAALDNGLARLPPMGWSTWCTENDVLPCYDDFCNEQEIRSVADAMAANGLKDLGYNYIVLDDCWGGGRDAQNNIIPDASRFPSGMKNLTDYIHARGLLFGVYTDVGTTTCRGGRPGSWPFYEQDARVFASWGLDYVKMDWCHEPSGFTAQELYTNMSQALNKTGRPIFFSICEWGRYDPWTWGMKVGNSWRVGPDHLPLWWTPPFQQDPGQGQGTANIIEHMAGLSSYAGPGGWNDPDFLMPGYWWLSENEQISEFSFWCLWASPLIVATDVRVLSDKKHILNKEAIAVNQDKLGIPGDRIANYTNGGQVWAKPLSNGSWAVILYNPNFFESVDIPVSWDQIRGWPAGNKNALVRDLWKHENQGVWSVGFLGKRVEAHAVRFITVTPYGA